MNQQKRIIKKQPLFALAFFIASFAFVSSALAQNLFGSLEFKAASLKGLPKWTSVLERSLAQAPAFKSCDKNLTSCEPKSLAHWRSFVQTHKGAPLDKKLLQELNTFSNAWQYTNDFDNYGVSDYWATPLEFLSRSGDCEDYVIFKFLTLKELGFDTDDIRLVVVKDTVRGIAHAVLAVYLKKEDEKEKTVYILDSLFDRVLEHTQVIQYVPYYSVTEKVRYAHVMPYKKASVKKDELKEEVRGRSSREDDQPESLKKAPVISTDQVSDKKEEIQDGEDEDRQIASPPQQEKQGEMQE